MDECCETCKFYTDDGWCAIFFTKENKDHKCSADYEPNGNDTF